MGYVFAPGCYDDDDVVPADTPPERRLEALLRRGGMTRTQAKRTLAELKAVPRVSDSADCCREDALRDAAVLAKSAALEAASRFPAYGSGKARPSPSWRH